MKYLPKTAEELWTGAMLLIDKPLDWSSFDVVNKVRYSINGKIKVGHAGTLDPRATGLLVVCTGRWTKRISEFVGLDKDYEGTFKMGETTPSYDSEAEVDQTFSTEHLNGELLEQATEKFKGKFEQYAPIYSALKVNGKRSYKLARAGVAVERKKREVTIDRFDLTKIALPEVDFFVTCSKGTYIRSLAHDFGAAVKSGAYLSALKRSRVGEYKLSNAHQLDTLIPYLDTLTKDHVR